MKNLYNRKIFWVTPIALFISMWSCCAGVTNLEIEEPVSSLKVQSPLGIFGVIQKKFPEAKIVFLYSGSEFDFCLYKIKYGEKELHIVLYSPKYSPEISLEINNAERTKDLGIASMNIYGILIGQDGRRADDRSIIYKQNFGSSFSADNEDKIELSVKLKGNSGSKLVIMSRSVSGEWSGSVK